MKDKNGNPSYGSLLATNASTPVDILVRLSHLPVPPIYGLSSNSNTPPELLEVLACDDKEFDRVLSRRINLAKRMKLSTPDVDYLVVKCQDIVDPSLMIKSVTTSLTRERSTMSSRL
jgi:hypothetical protein